MKLLDHWFYGRATAQSNVYLFDAEETLHATRALRLGVGDQLQWLDGMGGRYVGEIKECKRAGMTAFAKTQTIDPKPCRIQLGVGVLHDATRLEWLIEKATELGVTDIRLLDTQRVQRTRHRFARLEAKAVAAMKQSGRSWLPQVIEQPLHHFIGECSEVGRPFERRLLAHCHADAQRKTLRIALIEQVQRDDEVRAMQPEEMIASPTCLLIGPEGDFTREEVDSLEATGFISISLGSARLRTETAAVAALSVIMLSE